MLALLSKKWIPFFIYAAVSGHLGDRYSTCEESLQNEPESIKFYGDPWLSANFKKLTGDLNEMLGELGVKNLKVYQVKEQVLSFLLYDRLFVGTKEFAEKPAKIRIMFAHEFAHAVFRKHFRITLFGETYSKVSLKNKIASLKKAKEPDSQKLRRILIGVENEILTYEEVFADLLTVLFFENPSVIAQAHGFPSVLELGLEQKFLDADFIQSVKFRELDFTARIDFDMWEKIFEQKFPFDSTGLGEYRAYRTMAPVRGEIYRKHLKSVHSEDRSLVLKAFLKATGQHLALRALREGTELNAGMNREFLDILSRELNFIIAR